MFSASKLSEDQKSALHRWAADGASIADLQKRLKDEFDIGITYMDARFLVLDLGIELLEAPKEEKKPEDEAAKPVPAKVIERGMQLAQQTSAALDAEHAKSGAQVVVLGRAGQDLSKYGLRYSHPALLQIHSELEESAQLSGANWFQTFTRIVVPLLIPALFAGWIFVFLISLRELAVAALVTTPKSPVIATTMLDLWANGNVNQVSAYGTLVATFSIIFAIAAYRFSRRFGLQA